MKKSLLLAVAMVALVSATALAGDGVVSKSTLRSVGLGQMSAMSDAQGMAVRGMSSNAQSTGLVAYAYIFYDVNSGSQFNGNGNSFSRATAENAGLNAASTASSNALTGQPLAFAVNVTTNGVTFTATLTAFSMNSVGTATGF